SSGQGVVPDLPLLRAGGSVLRQELEARRHRRGEVMRAARSLGLACLLALLVAPAPRTSRAESIPSVAPSDALVWYPDRGNPLILCQWVGTNYEARSRRNSATPRRRRPAENRGSRLNTLSPRAS